MRKAIFTYFKSWHNANALLLGLAILITGFTPVSQPNFDLVTHHAAVDAAALADNSLLSEAPLTASFAAVSSPTLMAPNQPVGFVANSATGSSVFIAVGPNNVGTNNIVYRLFYSPTASAPADPLTATQHTFGSIPGDGNGTAAFGFSIAGLTAGTGYTFWLYQYNTVDMLYSIPAVVTRSTLSPPAAPTTNAPDPTCPVGNVVSVYGDFYPTNIATNYNPNWGQSGFGSVNPNFNPGTGNVILAYPNFNYQGTELTQTNLSGMTFINFDVWIDANPATTILKVSPINQGTGPAEVLVTVPHVQGQWTRISLPKSAFGGMTWDAVFQLKFAANGPASTVPVDVYLDNIYFSTCGVTPPPTPPSQPVGFVALNPSSSSAFLAAGPNNVGANNIVYRLFYSPTASAPGNPLTATQYNFGSTGGDGNGVSPFGFNLGGLTAATPYTFWLYQYNTASMLYSTPAVATLTTLSPPVLPTTNAPDPTCPPANVVSVYGDFYSPNIATNYNPNWGQSGFALTNPNYNPGTGNVILAYRNFNYQGTELTQTNLSNMAYLNFDVWTDASPSTTTLQVSPINQGTGPSEVLVTVPYVRGQWTRISLPKSAFGGMTWNAVFQMKFAANGPASLVPVDIYLDNIFFSTTNCAYVAPPTVVCKNATVALGGNGSYTLTAADVFNAAASVNNCAGALTVTNISPATVSCAQLGQTIPVTITVQDGCGNTATCTAQITVQQGSALPGGWSSNNVGNANGSGSYKPCTGAEFTLTASGFSTSSADVMHLVSRQLCGNGEIIARVGNIQNSGWAGITLRESLAPGSKMVALKMQSNISNIRRMIRATTNGAASNLSYFRPQDTWLRLVRNGSNFIGYTSSNGTSWSFAFSATIPMAGCVYAGLFAESINVNVITTAVFGNVSITGGAPTLATDINAIVTAAPELKVYPNPTSGEITLDLSAYPARNLRIELYNIQGKVLQIVEKDNAETNTESFNLSAYGAGIYLIRVQSEGLPDAVKRVIVQ